MAALGWTVFNIARLAAAPVIVPLWPGRPPGFIADAGAETIDAAGAVSNVGSPSMAVHLPARGSATGAALIVCPGGSYTKIGLFDSGMGLVDYFVPKGVAVIVLKYRTRPPSRDVTNDALADAKRAVRLVRVHALEWGLEPTRIGMVGSSAGSHLVLNLATHWDRGELTSSAEVDSQSCRPNFICLLCPWPNQQPVSDFPVTGSTPPAFIASARDDKVAPTTFAQDIAAAYQRAGVNHSLWLVDKGGHTAFTLGGNRGEGAQWRERFSSWLGATMIPSPLAKQNLP